MGRRSGWSQIVWWALCNHKGIHRGREEGQSQRCDDGSGGWGDVGPGAKDAGSFQKLEKAKKWILPRKEHSPAHPLILAQRPILNY